MTDTDQRIAAGRLLKPHGINGEIAAAADIDGLELRPGQCIFVEIDGLDVPFYINSVRHKGRGDLLGIDGITDETEAMELAGLPFAILASDAPEEELADGDGFYAADLVGFAALEDSDDDTPAPLGEITGIEDSTANTLFIIATPDDTTLYIPVADEYITDIDPDRRTITFALPEGLKDLSRG